MADRVRLDSWLGDITSPPADPPIIGSRPPGLVGDVADWVVRSARFPDWEMAVGVGIAVVGATMAPTVVGPTLSSTVTYQLILGGSASGKQHPQNCIERLLPLADVKISTGRYNSAAGLEEDIKTLKNWFCFFDEFGDWLEQLTHKNAVAGPLWGVVQTMKMLWGLSEPGSTYRTARTKLIDSEAIERPTFLHIGTTTEDAFYRALSLARGLIVSGWLNRYLIRKAARRGEEQDPELSLMEGVPKTLAAGIKELAGFVHSGPTYGRLQWQMNWETNAAKEVYQSLSRSMRSQDEVVEVLQARVAENAIRLATILAGGCLRRTVSVSDIEWGASEALQSLQTLRAGLDKYRREELEFPQLCEALYDYVWKQPDHTCPYWRVSRDIGRKARWKRAFEDAIEMLVNQRRIVVRDGKDRPQGGGTAGKVLMALPD